MKGINKFLIAVWGNPKSWKEIEYYYKNSSLTSKGTIPIIKQIENPNKIILICSDTLIDNLLNEIETNNYTPSYKDLKKYSENDIKNFCKSNFNFEPDKVIIGYGFGEFNKTKFIGNPQDFYYHILKDLISTLKDYINLNNNQIEIIFDITHGINYTTALTHKALKEILQILAYFFNIKFKILNSDPFVGRSDVNKLNINIIEDTIIFPNLVFYKTQKNPIEPNSFKNQTKPKEINPEQFEQIGREINKFLNDISFDNKKHFEDIYNFLASFMYALPIYIISYLPNYIDLQDKIEKIFQKYQEYISIEQPSLKGIEHSSLKIEIIRKLRFSNNFENLLKAFLISFILSKKGFTQLTEIPLDNITTLKQILYDNKFPVESNRIDKEIEDIKEILEKFPTNDYKAYSEIKSEIKAMRFLNEQNKTTNNKYSKEVDKRNFFAHAGFEYNCIMIKKDEKIKLKINENSREKIEKFLKNDLKTIE